MLCQICKKREATVYIKQVINGKVTELHLCDKCAEKEGLNESFFAPGAIFANLITGLSFLESSLELEEETKCPGCGISYSEIMNKGKIGCSFCYDTFGDYLTPILERVHGRVTHRGKVPRRIRTKGRLLEKAIYNLRLKLEEAVKKEEYERAARLRDKIKKLKEKDEYRQSF